MIVRIKTKLETQDDNTRRRSRGLGTSTKDTRDHDGGAGFIARDASEDVLAAVARAVDNDGDDDAPARAPQAGFPSSGSSGSRAREQEY